MRRNRRQVGPLLVAADGRTPLTAVMWRCSTCHEPKPESAFTVTDGATGRRRAACNVCEALRLRVRAARGDRRTVRVAAPATVTVRVRPTSVPDFEAASLASLVGGC